MLTRIIERLRLRTVAAMLLLSTALILPVSAQAPQEAQDSGPPWTLEDAYAVFGVAAGTVFHELGHAFITEFDVPAIAFEEDVADSVATLALVSSWESRTELQESIIPYWAGAWYYLSIIETTTSSPTRFSPHAPSDRRANNTQCLIYGAIPEWIPQGFDENSRLRCIREYHRQLRAFDRLRVPHLRSEGSTRGRVTATFDDLEDESQWGYWESVQSYIENEVQWWGRELEWPRDLTVAFRHCNHFGHYVEQEAEITVCYESIRTLATLVRQIAEELAAVGEPGR